MKTRVRKSYDLFSIHNYYTPNLRGTLALMGMFIIGTAIASLITLIATPLGLGYIEIVTYPIMFIPALLYASAKSKQNEFFDIGCCKLDSNNFGNYNFLIMAIITASMTLAASVTVDITNFILPPMPESLKKVFDSLLKNQPIILTLVSVSVFAPLFEEWLCRGLILRGLLKTGSRPAIAIAISSFLFAALHMNPWQAIPAFVLGSLFGYVYYKTGSLKLTMLMHCVNNTAAVVLSKMPSLEKFDTYYQILGEDKTTYVIAIAASMLIIAFTIYLVSRIDTTSPQSPFQTER